MCGELSLRLRRRRRRRSGEDMDKWLDVKVGPERHFRWCYSLATLASY